MLDTKDRILDTAERLFGEQGYAATSLRHIIAEADVNLAAIHYHFGSKEELLEELVGRLADPVNRARIALLDQLEAVAAGRPLSIESILEAFLGPAAQMSSRCSIKLMGRLYGEGLMPAIVERHFKPTGKRFVNALRRALPSLPEEEFFWRVDFMIGAMSHAMIRTQIIGHEHNVGERAVPVSARDDTPDMSPGSQGARKLASMVRFLSEGFRAPSALSVEKVEISR